MAARGKVENFRFLHLSKEEISQKKSSSTPKNTVKANLQAAKAFRAYLEETGEETCFESFSEEKLNSHLEGFWLSARKQKIEAETPGSIQAGTDGGKLGFYKASTLENYRHSLNRYLKSPPNDKHFDIIKDRQFSESNQSFKAALRELKNIGKGEISHYPEIEEIDLGKLYSNFEKLQDPIILQEKVQFDLRFYFFRRGSENIHDMTKSTFEVKTDANTGEKYVCQAKDELNKNHNEFDRESYSARMPEMPGNPRCPVASFEMYIQHLNPDCPSLWQRPKDKDQIKNHIWYYRKCVGLNTLQGFMKNLSAKYQLSRVYTNHSVRVTGATILSRKNYAPSQIQSVTGHKSLSSLAVYQRVSNQEKMQMGKSLGENLMSIPSTSSEAPSYAQEPTIHGQQPLKTLDLNTLSEIGMASAPTDNRSMPGPSSDAPVNLNPTNNMLQRQPQIPAGQQEPEADQLEDLPDFDIELSPILRDLEVYEFEHQSQEIRNVGNVNQVITNNQRINVRSPIGAAPSFRGCSIHNVIVNVYPRK